MANLDLKILCIDDEPDILEIYGQVVTSAGFTPILCTSPVDAEQRFRDEIGVIALVISDMQMPLKSGLEFRAAILPEGLAVPFLVVSSFITKELALQAIDLKIDGFFDKPLSDLDLVGLIEKFAKPRLESIRESQMIEAIFLEEATDIIDEMDSVLLALDHERSSVEQLNLIFRGIHTIKGSSGVLPSPIVTRYAHRYEDIISSLKKGELEFTDPVYEILLKGFDRIKELIAAAKAKTLRTYRLEDILKDLELHPVAGASAGVTQQQGAKEPPQAAAQQKPKDSISVPIEILEKLSGCSGEITVIRNMVNKLVRSIAQQNPGSSDVQNLGELLDEMHKVNGTVQTYITDLRKVPISNVLRTVPRIVRDLSKDLKKPLALKVEGEKLRIDNSLAHVLSNSLVHLLRNSADHGIEDPATRKALGKPETGSVIMDCREVGEEILITIKDDGRGIDPEKIRAKALEKGLYTAAQLGEMSPSQTLAIIFASGFSTAAKVSDVSGRGVGMDMVKTSVEAVGGNITIDSQVGRGSTFTLRLPVPRSVLIITSLIVECAGRVFALPQDSIQRVMRIDLALAPDVLQMASLGKTLRLGELIFPLVSLRSILSLDLPVSQNLDTASATSNSDILSVLILKTENLEYALLVDRIHDSEEIVVKRMNSCFNPTAAFAGATFMGDGSVGLILDVAGIAKLANLDSSKTAGAADVDTASHADSAANIKPEKLQNFLLFRLKGKALFGVPLGQVFRLEELDSAKIKRSGAERVIIYRDSVMPLLAFDRLLNLASAKDELDHDKPGPIRLRIPTIVAKGADGYFGLEVESVIDIAETEAEVSPAIRDRKGIVGNTFIREHNVTIVDLEKVLDKRISA